MQPLPVLAVSLLSNDEIGTVSYSVAGGRFARVVGT